MVQQVTHPVFFLDETFNGDDIDMRSTKMEIGFVKINPKLAKAMLKHNENNRAVRASILEKLETNMTQGTFEITHQGISFKKDGTLMDGQHRLTAIVETNATVIMPVAVGMNSSLHIDQGAKRSESDTIRLENTDLKWVDSRVMALVNLYAAEFPALHLITTEDKTAFIRAFEDSIHFAFSACSKSQNIRSAAVLTAFACAHSAGADAAKLTDAGRALVTGMVPLDNVDLHINTMFALRNWLLNLKMNNGASKNHFMFYATAQTIKNYLDGKNIKKIKVPESFPFKVRNTNLQIIN